MNIFYCIPSQANMAESDMEQRIGGKESFFCWWLGGLETELSGSFGGRNEGIVCLLLTFCALPHH